MTALAFPAASRTLRRTSICTDVEPAATLEGAGKNPQPGKVGDSWPVVLVNETDCVPIKYVKSHATITPVDNRPSNVQSLDVPPVPSVHVSLPEGPVTVKLATSGGVTTSVAVCTTLLYAPEIVTVCVVVVVVIDIVKVPVDAPAGIVTLAGTVATVVTLEDSVTTVPPVGAGWFSVAVPCTDPPPMTVAALSVIDERANGGGVAATIRITVRVAPLYEAVNVIVNAPPVSRVVTVNDALVAPAGTVTLDAICATPASLL